MTSVSCFKLLRLGRGWDYCKDRKPPAQEFCRRRGEGTWSGNFHHNGRTAFQVRRRTTDHGGHLPWSNGIIIYLLVQTNTEFTSQLTPHGPV